MQSTDQSLVALDAATTECPYCGAGGTVFVLAKDHNSSDETSWPYWRCRNCAALWLDRVPADLHAYYRADYYTHSPAALDGRIRAILIHAVLAARYGFPATGLARFLAPLTRAMPIDTGASRFLRHIEGGKLLDVGCGSGDFVEFLRSYRWDVQGIEPDEQSAHICASRGIKTIHSDAESAVLPTDYFDAITLHHSLEHMRNPAAVITRLVPALKSGGSIVVVTPNAAGFPAQHFGRYWRSLDPPRHTAISTPRALDIMMKRAGLVVRIRTVSKNVGWVCRASIALRDAGSLRFQPSHSSVLGLTLVSKLAVAFDSMAGEEIICIATKL